MDDLGTYPLEPQFFEYALNALSEQIAILDARANIVFVNDAWVNFSAENGGSTDTQWLGINYLSAFEHHKEFPHTLIGSIWHGIHAVINLHQIEFRKEYPCSSASEHRWFSMCVRQMHNAQQPYFIVSHYDVTERKKLEEETVRLSLTDSLTGLANRRYFQQFLDQQWHRALRAKSPISLILIDIDHFKKINDEHGHLVGDECLAAVGKLIARYARRETDMAARYGGEEFALILGNASVEYAHTSAEEMRMDISGLKLSIPQLLTASCGVTALVPNMEIKLNQLIAHADEALYDAKRSGRNCTVKHHDSISNYSLPRNPPL